MTMVLEGGEGSASRPGRSLPPGKTPVPIVQEAGWTPRAGLDRCGKSRPPYRDSIPGPFSPVASRYTDWATGPTKNGAIACIPTEGLESDAFWRYVCDGSSVTVGHRVWYFVLCTLAVWRKMYVVSKPDPPNWIYQDV